MKQHGKKEVYLRKHSALFYKKIAENVDLCISSINKFQKESFITNR
jgi:hypothetical protein